VRVYKTSEFLRLDLFPLPLTRQRNRCIRVPGIFVVIDNSRIHVSQISQPQCSRCAAKAHPTAPAAAATNPPPSASLPPPARPRPPAHNSRRSGAPSSPCCCCCCCCCPVQLAARSRREPRSDSAATPRFGHCAGGSYSRPCCPHVQWPGCLPGCPWPGAHS